MIKALLVARSLLALVVASLRTITLLTIGLASAVLVVLLMGLAGVAFLLDEPWLLGRLLVAFPPDAFLPEPPDPELRAAETMERALKPLDLAARNRVLAHAQNRLVLQPFVDAENARLDRAKFLSLPFKPGVN